MSARTLAVIQPMTKGQPRWGAPRLQGELLKLESKVATTTLPIDLRATREDRAPRQTGSVFLKNHTRAVWACDLLPVIDLCFRTVEGFCAFELASRRMVNFGVTRQPSDAGVAQ